MYLNGKNISFTDRSVDSVNNFLNLIRKSNPLTNEQEHDLWLHMQQGSSSAREQLIFNNLSYVVSVAKKYLASKSPFEDLIMAGCEGIVKACNRFDGSYGVRFISFATWYIENEIRKEADGYTRNHHDSLDESSNPDKKRYKARIENIPTPISESTDWNLRYIDCLNNLKERMDEQIYGYGEWIGKLHQMLVEGYTTKEFAKLNHLSESQMNHLLMLLKKEAGLLRPTASRRHKDSQSQIK
jgi:RNA polymerase sigma factor (sigma-70 family)